MDLSVKKRMVALQRFIYDYRAIAVEASLKFCQKKDRENDIDPRAFAEVRTDHPGIIWATRRIACLRPENQYAILLHEIGHIHLDALDGSESEPTVDTWIVGVFPESNYHYRDCQYNLYGVHRTARNLQVVSKHFAQEIDAQAL